MDVPHSHPGLSTQPSDWEAIRAIDLVQNQKVIVLEANTSVESACEVLIINGISSVPVLDRNTRTFVGMFDYADLLTYILLLLRRTKLPEDEKSTELAASIARLASTESISVRQASDLSKKNPFCSIPSETSFSHVAEVFGTGVHRLAVLDGDGTLRGILTQSNLVHYLTQHMSEFPALVTFSQQKLQELGVKPTQVISVNINVMVVDALSLLCDYGVSSVAVVDDNDYLYGNVSLSDVKHVIRHGKHALLYASCQKFVSHVKMEQGIHSGQDTVPVFDVHMDSTLAMAMGKLTATRAHRLWITDSGGILMGVLSLTDVTRLLSQMADTSNSS